MVCKAWSISMVSIRTFVYTSLKRLKSAQNPESKAPPSDRRSHIQNGSDPRFWKLQITLLMLYSPPLLRHSLIKIGVRYRRG